MVKNIKKCNEYKEDHSLNLMLIKWDLVVFNVKVVMVSVMLAPLLNKA
jgi:hypothetical protein